MNRTKTRLLKQMYNRRLKKRNGTGLIKQIIIDNWNSLPDSTVKDQDKIEFRMTDKSTSYLDDIKVIELEDAPIWTFYEYLRAYHLIEIMVIIIIAIGAYLWLK